MMMAAVLIILFVFLISELCNYVAVAVRKHYLRVIRSDLSANTLESWLFFSPSHLGSKAKEEERQPARGGRVPVKQYR